MTAENTTPADEMLGEGSTDTITSTEPDNVAFSAANVVEAESVSATLSAIASVRSNSLDATGSAIVLASVDGDAEVTASAVPILSAKGDATFRQAYASAFIAGGDVKIVQGGAPLILGKSVDIEQGGAIAMVTGEASVKRGFIGVLLSPRADVSDDSRVVVGPKAALIIGAVLLGGFGLVALAIFFGAKRVASWRPIDFDFAEFAERMPWRRAA